jgi:hypothetical protein
MSTCYHESGSHKPNPDNLVAVGSGLPNVATHPNGVVRVDVPVAEAKPISIGVSGRLISLKVTPARCHHHRPRVSAAILLIGIAVLTVLMFLLYRRKIIDWMSPGNDFGSHALLHGQQL